MKRTTIMLPEDLRRRALLCAKLKRVSLSELIRDSSSVALPGVSYDALADPLFEDVVFDGPGRTDVSDKHDRYLYDDER